MQSLRSRKIGETIVVVENQMSKKMNKRVEKGERGDRGRLIGYWLGQCVCVCERFSTTCAERPYNNSLRLTKEAIKCFNFRIK